MGERLPTILSKGIEDVYKTLNQEVSSTSSEDASNLELTFFLVPSFAPVRGG